MKERILRVIMIILITVFIVGILAGVLVIFLNGFDDNGANEFIATSIAISTFSILLAMAIQYISIGEYNPFYLFKKK